MLAAGTRFSRFRIETLLGQGGGGEVYRAHDPTLDRAVALKILFDAAGTGAARALREARATASIHHPNVVTVFEVGEERSVPFIVMELLHGKRLSQVMVGAEPTPLERRLQWLIEIAEALDAAHARGIVHRDVKPSNVLICDDGGAKVFDFGIATRATGGPDDEPHSTQPGWIRGTPRYMSPEHLRGVPLDGRADQYAWGLIAYELLSGVPPLPDEASSPGDGFVKPLAEIRHDLPPRIVSVVTRSLCPTRDHRFPSMRELILALVGPRVEALPTESGNTLWASEAPKPGANRDHLAAGTVVAGKYRIERPLGSGGMGVVYRAHHLVLDQPVALKLLRARVAGNPMMVTRFLNEARTALSIQSSHVARVLDVDTEDGAPFIVMELLDGVDLGKLLERSGPLSSITAVDYVMQALEAIAEAHALGVVHRDLKPANLFLARRATGGDAIKVLDFGVSKMRPQGPEALMMTTSEHIIGSPDYMSPEQVEDPSSVDARADVWALGVIMYELITGEVPFKAESALGILNAVLTQPIVPPSQIRPVLPLELEAKIMRCLERNRDARYPHVLALAEAIAPFGPANAALAVERIATVTGLPRVASLVVADAEPPPTIPRSNGWLVAAVIGAVVLGGIGFGVRAALSSHAQPMPASPPAAVSSVAPPPPIASVAPPVVSVVPPKPVAPPTTKPAVKPPSTAKPSSSYDPFAAPRTP